MADPQWKDRITGSETVAADSLTAHPLNYRDHPQSQREAVDTMLGEIGWIKEVIVNQRTGRVIDGHLRVERAQAQGDNVPVLYVDLSKNEEALVLATLDPLADMAGTDTQKLADVLDEFDRDRAAVDALFHQIAEANGIDNTEGEGGDPDSGSGEGEPKIVKCPRCGHRWAPEGAGE